MRTDKASTWMDESRFEAWRGADGGHDALSSWVGQLDAPGPEATRSRLLARTGGVAAVLALAVYLTWRIGWTLHRPSSWNGQPVAVGWPSRFSAAIKAASSMVVT